ncbi:hypothetical protein HZS_2376 [Henneguya salminicola]|nr:hypothetical protein HZS_2376 [Henneguya salminicola]
MTILAPHVRPDSIVHTVRFKAYTKPLRRSSSNSKHFITLKDPISRARAPAPNGLKNSFKFQINPRNTTNGKFNQKSDKLTFI